MEFRNIVIGDEIYGQDLIRKEVDKDFDFTHLSRRYSVTSAKYLEDSRLFDSSVISFELSQDKITAKKNNKITLIE